MKTRYELGKELCRLYETRDIPLDYINKHVDFSASDEDFEDMVDFIDHTTDLPEPLRTKISRHTQEQFETLQELGLI